MTDVGFAVERGHILALLGPNGSGKSTLISLLVGLQTPAAGSVYVNGRPTTALRPPELARMVACVPQDHHPCFRFTVREMLIFGRSPHLGWLGLTASDDQARLERIADLLQLTALLDRAYTELSGGEIKRVLLARALLQDVPMLILDEPDAHLDLPNQHRFLAVARHWVAAGARLALFSTHNPDLALRFSTHCLLMPGDGKPLVYGPTHAVLTKTNLEALYGLAVEELTSPSGSRILWIGDRP